MIDDYSKLTPTEKKLKALEIIKNTLKLGTSTCQFPEDSHESRFIDVGVYGKSILIDYFDYKLLKEVFEND